MYTRRYSILFLIATQIFCGHWRAGEPPASSSMGNVATEMKSEIELHGTASGGFLALSMCLSRRPAYVVVETHAGESAAAVLARLATKINETDPFLWWGRDRPNVRRSADVSGVKAVGNKLTELGSGLILGGTDRGFDIPEPPVFLSGSYELDNDRLVVRWVNPRQDHDRIRCSGKTLPAGSSMCVFDRADLGERWAQEVSFAVIAMRGKTPSCAGLITVRTNAQEELANFPFYNGVMPNWATWSTSDDPSATEFTQGIKEGVPPRAGIERRQSKKFYQVVRVRRAGVQAGIWRKFLGLIPGHVYRISARLSTLEIEARSNDWSLALCAAYTPNKGGDFTVSQLAGVEALPDGQLGEGAGRIAAYGPGSVTGGGWVEHSTADSTAGMAIKHIALPRDADSITVWVRHSGVTTSGIGIDWVRCEDMGLRE